MHVPAHPSARFFGPGVRLTIAAGIFSPVILLAVCAAGAWARPPRAERIAERRYARMSIAEARVARAEARVAEIAPVVPEPPPPRPATLRRLARAGVPLGGPMPPPVVASRPQAVRPPTAARRSPADPPVVAGQAAPRPAASAAPPPAVSEPGVWTLDPEEGVARAAAEVTPDGTRSVLSAGGTPPKPTTSPQPAAPAIGRSGPAVTQPPIELLPTPEAN